MTNVDPGCCCAGGGYPCGTCDIPESALTATVVTSPACYGAGAGTGTGTMAYYPAGDGTGGVPNWYGHITSGTFPFDLRIFCNPLTHQVIFQVGNPPNTMQIAPCASPPCTTVNHSGQDLYAGNVLSYSLGCTGGVFSLSVATGTSFLGVCTTYTVTG